MCFAPLRALFEQLNFQKRSEKEVCFYLLAFKCASRRSFWFIIPPDGSAPSAVASLLYFLTLRSPKTLDKHSVSRLCLLLRSFSILFAQCDFLSTDSFSSDFSCTCCCICPCVGNLTSIFSVNYVLFFSLKTPQTQGGTWGTQFRDWCWNSVDGWVSKIQTDQVL